MERSQNKQILQLLIEGKVDASLLQDKTVKTLLGGGTLLSMDKGDVKECFFDNQPIDETRFNELCDVADRLGLSKPFNIEVVIGGPPIST